MYVVSQAAHVADGVQHKVDRLSSDVQQFDERVTKLWLRYRCRTFAFTASATGKLLFVLMSFVYFDCIVPSSVYTTVHYNFRTMVQKYILFIFLNCFIQAFAGQQFIAPQGHTQAGFIPQGGMPSGPQAGYGPPMQQPVQNSYQYDPSYAKWVQK